VANGERGGWAPIDEIVAPYTTEGLAIRRRALSYTTPAIARVFGWAGYLAKERGGRLQIADVSRSQPGTFPPHKSHKYGRDADVGYTLDRYPTPLTTSATPSFAWILCQLRPYLQKVFVSTARREQLRALAKLQGCQLPTLEVYPGHQTHAHLRFIAPSPAEPDDDDGDDHAQDYFLPDWADDSGWRGVADGYPFVRAVLQAYLDAPEQLQSGPAGQPSPASLELSVRAFNWYRSLRQPGWPTVYEACNFPASGPCDFYRHAADYFYKHEAV